MRFLNLTSEQDGDNLQSQKNKDEDEEKPFMHTSVFNLNRVTSARKSTIDEMGEPP